MQNGLFTWRFFKNSVMKVFQELCHRWECWMWIFWLPDLTINYPSLSPRSGILWHSGICPHRLSVDLSRSSGSPVWRTSLLSCFMVIGINSRVVIKDRGIPDSVIPVFSPIWTRSIPGSEHYQGFWYWLWILFFKDCLFLTSHAKVMHMYPHSFISRCLCDLTTLALQKSLFEHIRTLSYLQSSFLGCGQLHDVNFWVDCF